MKDTSKPTFVPQLYVGKNGADAVEFYKKAFGAIELRRWSNDDGTVHVSELEIGGAMFHLHEEKPAAGQFSPERIGGVTVLIGLMVSNPDEVMTQAISAGAKELSPMQSYDYGYRQGEVLDPFGHKWMIEMAI